MSLVAVGSGTTSGKHDTSSLPLVCSIRIPAVLELVASDTRVWIEANSCRVGRGSVSSAIIWSARQSQLGSVRGVARLDGSFIVL